MNEDTVFDALSDGEEIIGVYRDMDWCTWTETVITLTDTRLLIRWKETFCCCGHQSVYDAITLNSIFRIHDTRFNRVLLLAWCAAAITGLILTIVGFATMTAIGGPFLGIGGIVWTLILVAFLIYIISLMRKKIIWLAGTFGNVSFRLTKTDAREFERQLSNAMNHNQRAHGDRFMSSSRKSPTGPAYNIVQESRSGRRMRNPSPGVGRGSYRQQYDA